MSKSQITLFQDFKPDELQSYIDKINKIQNANLSKLNPDKQELYQSLQLKQYANALKDVEASQVALLLSTQGLSTAQIQQILATKGLNTELQYQAMAEAGLLKSKQALSNVELQNTLVTSTGNKERAEAIMQTMGLSVAIEGEEAQTVQLTAKKLQLATATGLLTKAEAEQIAMTLGVAASQKTVITSTMPQWIASMKTMVATTWAQVKATVAWMATNPVGWATLAIGAIAGVRVCE